MSALTLAPSAPLARPGILPAPRDLFALLKPRIAVSSALAAAVGYHVAGGAWGAAAGGAMLAVTALAGGASCLNMILERDVDARMRRTASRPLPAGRLYVGEAIAVGLAACAFGLLGLERWGGAVAALVGGVTLALYVLVYTPLKRWSPTNTIVGAVPGALPPVIGWAAAGAPLDGRAAALFAILFLWQLPHFLAIALLYREDYARGGLVMLPVVDPESRATGRQAVVYAAYFLPALMAPYALGMAGLSYAAAAGAFGLWYLGSSVAFWRAPAPVSARRLFVCSLIVLAGVFGALWLDASERPSSNVRLATENASLIPAGPSRQGSSLASPTSPFGSGSRTAALHGLRLLAEGKRA